MAKKETIVCAAWKVDAPFLTTVVIPNNRLPMDIYNEFIKNGLARFITHELYYITSNGRTVDETEAFMVAFEADQLPEEGMRSRDRKLNPLDLWPRKTVI